MTNNSASVSERSLSLRREALEICDRMAWSSRCIGREDFEVGVPEIYEELRCLQKVSAVYVSQALIDCCRRHDLWTPLFLDVEARIWLFLGERQRAEKRWKSLLMHPKKKMRDIADDALSKVKSKVDSLEMLSTEVDQAWDRAEFAVVDKLLSDAIVRIDSSDNFDKLEIIIESNSRQRPPTEGFPWDSKLLRNELMLSLLESQIYGLEKKFAG